MKHPDRNLEPPAALEARVVRALCADGLIRATPAKETDVKTLHIRWAIAASVLLLAGVFVGSYGARPLAAPGDARPQFALLLYEDAAYQQPAEDALEARIAEYSRWAGELASAGRLVDAGKLSDTGAFLTASSDATSNVPRSEEGVLAGYFVIRAADRAEAERVARECPHLKYGGTISLRDIEA